MYKILCGVRPTKNDLESRKMTSSGFSPLVLCPRRPFFVCIFYRWRWIEPRFGDAAKSSPRARGAIVGPRPEHAFSDFGIGARTSRVLAEKSVLLGPPLILFISPFFLCCPNFFVRALHPGSSFFPVSRNSCCLYNSYRSQKKMEIAIFECD